MKKLLLLTGILLASYSQAQDADFLMYCNQAYTVYPDVPRGVLEAVSFTQTRMHYLSGNEAESCSGIPKSVGYLGMVGKGKGYFRENLKLVSALSGYSIQQMKSNPQTELLAYAKVVQGYLHELQGMALPDQLNEVFSRLSYLPLSGKVNAYARDAERYELFRFLNNNTNAQTFNFPVYQFDLAAIFGAENLAVLSAPKVLFTEQGIRTVNGAVYESLHTPVIQKSNEYGPAVWNPAPSCNFSSRNGTAISAITIHTIQGTYAGAISWAQNCSSSVSYHYVVRSSDGQITQMVLEANKAWHVGSENPYTIGYEHEGYVSQTGWYTTAMYNASASLTRDICNSGYGINPLRTFFGAATSGLNTLGSCTKIKGHQHYPNQTHTDPGIYWDWELYYRLVNNNPSQTALTSNTGTFYDTGGSGGNYQNDERYLTLIQPAGAGSVTLNFTSFNVEANWDYLYIYDGANLSAPLIGVYTGTNSPGTVTSTGGALLLEFRSDCATVSSGWVANWTSAAGNSVNPDVTPPATTITTPNNWITQNFTTLFTDTDNSGGSGLEKAFYQVIDYDGTEWRGNAQRGFFSDNFDLAAIHPDWTAVQGTWSLSGGNLVQDDETNANTNLYAFLDHSLSNRYLYHWAGAISGTGTNRRAGLHYFCDDPALANRGNSYFVYFRLDNAKVQLYKVTNDVFSLVDEVDYTFTAGQWYDFKVAYDRITGKHQVYIDNVLVQTWTDTAPLSSGNYFSLRSGNCSYKVNNMKVFRSRYPAVNVTVGINGDIRYQSPDPSTHSGRIKSLVQDSAGNLSAIAFQDVFVDWTAPNAIVAVNDGSGTDIATTTSMSTLEANWTPSADTNSDIARYWYAIGTSPGMNDVRDWTDNFWNTGVSANGLSLSIGTTYYVSVRSENGAGLYSGITSSDGQTVVVPTNPPVADFLVQNTFVCVTDSVMMNNTSADATSYAWTATGALNPSSNLVNPFFRFPATGSYSVQLIAYGPNTSDTSTQVIYVQVSQLNSSGFQMNADTLYLPNATLTCTNNAQNANGYAWNFGDGSESQDMNPWHLYTNPGVYEVRLIAVNDACPQDTSMQQLVVLNTLGLGNEDKQDVLIYPNPALDVVTILLPEQAQFLEVRDLAGKVIYEIKTNDPVVYLDLHHWAAGVYLVRVDSGSRWYESRLMKR